MASSRCYYSLPDPEFCAAAGTGKRGTRVTLGMEVESPPDVKGPTILPQLLGDLNAQRRGMLFYGYLLVARFEKDGVFVVPQGDQSETLSFCGVWFWLWGNAPRLSRYPLLTGATFWLISRLFVGNWMDDWKSTGHGWRVMGSQRQTHGFLAQEGK